MTISLCLVVWNEVSGCKHDVPLLPIAQFDETFAIDGGSDDGTVEYLQSVGIPVHTQPKCGLNAAYHHAMAISQCDAVVVFFPKATIPPDSLLNFRQLFDEGYDFIIASRQIKGSFNEEDSKLFRPRKWAVWWLGILVAILWCRDKPWIRDVLHGYKGFTKFAFDRMGISDSGLTIDMEMTIRSYKKSVKRIEFPVQEVPRPFGSSNFPFFSTGRELLACLFFEIFHKNH